MAYQLGSLLLLTGLLAGGMLIDPPAPDALRGAAMAAVGMRFGASAAAEHADGLAVPTPTDEAELEVREVALALATPRPTEWMSKVRRCRRRGARRYCDGPRMVAQPHGAAAELAEALELGDRRTASLLLTRQPREEWTAAVGAEAAGDILFPVEEGRMGRGFGFVRRASLRHLRHDGVDIPAAHGTMVRAVDDAIVAYADNGVSGYGNLVLLVHGDGGTSLYAHLRASYFFAGQRVTRGQAIGEVGTTGLSQAPHLHFEYRRGGHLVDPVPHFTDLPERVAATLEDRAARDARREARHARRARRARQARRAAARRTRARHG